MKLYCDVSCCESVYPCAWHSVSPFKFETHVFILALFLVIYLLLKKITFKISIPEKLDFVEKMTTKQNAQRQRLWKHLTCMKTYE